MKFSLEKLRSRLQSREISDHMKDGTEIVWCNYQNGEYVGWVEREFAEVKGYQPVRTEADPALMAAIDVAIAAYNYVHHSRGDGGWRQLTTALEKFEP